MVVPWTTTPIDLGQVVSIVNENRFVRRLQVCRKLHLPAFDRARLRRQALHLRASGLRRRLDRMRKALWSVRSGRQRQVRRLRQLCPAAVSALRSPQLKKSTAAAPTDGAGSFRASVPPKITTASGNMVGRCRIPRTPPEAAELGVSRTRSHRRCDWL